MAIQITPITKPLKHGDGPHWDANTQSLYFVDIAKSTIHKYVPSSKKHNYTKVVSPDLGEKPVSLIIPVKDTTDEFVISYGNDLALIKWDGINDVTDFKILITLEENLPELRFNDGKASPRGILFAGTTLLENIFDASSSIYAGFYTFANQITRKLIDDVGISKGFAWSNDEKILYYIDSSNLRVEAFDYDAEKLEIDNRRTIFDFRENRLSSEPAGMTMDTDGNLWIACFDGGQVIKIDPKTGKLLTSINLPCRKITSVAFGGNKLEDLYVTSANLTKPVKEVKINPVSEGWIKLSGTGAKFEKEVKIDPTAGCLFKISSTGAKGIAGVSVNL